MRRKPFDFMAAAMAMIGLVNRSHRAAVVLTPPDVAAALHPRLWSRATGADHFPVRESNQRKIRRRRRMSGRH
jgi:hypothetical protein